MRNTLLRFAISVFSMIAITSCGGGSGDTSLSITSEETSDVQTGPIELVGFGYLGERIVIEDGFIRVPDADKDGYEFDGWYYDEAYTRAFDPYAPLEENTKLYAKFMERTFTEIKTKEDLLAMNVDGNYVLTTNIDLGGEHITPFGTYANPFKGEFNGKNFTISNFVVDSDEFAALFGVVTGKVVDLQVKNNFNIETNASLLVGGVVAVNQMGIIKNCYTSGRIVVSGTSSASTIYAGGVVARNDRGTVTRCGSNMNISNNNEGVAISGGVVAYNGGSISYKNSIVENCIGKNIGITSVTFNTRTAAYSGGVVGFNFGIVNKCISYGQNITAQCSEYQCFAAGVVADNNGGRITNSFSASNINVSTERGSTFRGAVVARNFEATTEENNGTYDNIYGFVGQRISFDISSQYETTSNNYQVSVPFVSVENASSKAWYENTIGLKGFLTKDNYYPSYNSEFKKVETEIASGLPGNPIAIRSVEELKNIECDKSYILEADLDLTNQVITPIGTYTRPYYGVFDGNNHKISNFNITVPSGGFNGLFGCINGTVKNLSISGKIEYKATTSKVSQYNSLIAGLGIRSYFENCNSDCEIDTQYYGGFAGGICGYAEYCEFKRCNVEGSISHYSLNKTNYAGGIAGLIFSSEIDECYAKMNFESSGRQLAGAGGLVGKMLYGHIHNSLAEASFGLVETSEHYIGGIAGVNSKGLISNCYAKLSSDEYETALIGGICGNNQDKITDSVYATEDEFISCGASSTEVKVENAKDLSKEKLLEYLGSAFAYNGETLCLAYTLGGK